MTTTTTFVLLLVVAATARLTAASPDDDFLNFFDDAPTSEQSDRFLATARNNIYFNSTNAVAIVSGIAIAVLLLAVGLYLYDFYGTARSDTVPQYNPYGQYDPNYTYRRNKRSNNDGYDFNAMNVIQWISMLQEVYEKFDYNDLECQKRLICEVLKEEEYFGSVSRKMKNGFQLARYLEVLNMPDDFRELLDEYLDASERSTGAKECQEFFQCPYSLKESVKRNFSGNSL